MVREFRLARRKRRGAPVRRSQFSSGLGAPIMQRSDPPTSDLPNHTPVELVEVAIESRVQASGVDERGPAEPGVGAHLDARSARQTAGAPPIIGFVDGPTFRVAGIRRRRGRHRLNSLRIEDIARLGKSVDMHDELHIVRRPLDPPAMRIHPRDIKTVWIVRSQRRVDQ
jgi:hypothetical protein